MTHSRPGCGGNPPTVTISAESRRDPQTHHRKYVPIVIWKAVSDIRVQSRQENPNASVLRIYQVVIHGVPQL